MEFYIYVAFIPSLVSPTMIPAISNKRIKTIAIMGAFRVGVDTNPVKIDSYENIRNNVVLSLIMSVYLL